MNDADVDILAEIATNKTKSVANETALAALGNTCVHLFTDNNTSVELAFGCKTVLCGKFSSGDYDSYSFDLPSNTTHSIPNGYRVTVYGLTRGDRYAHCKAHVTGTATIEPYWYGQANNPANRGQISTYSQLVSESNDTRYKLPLTNTEWNITYFDTVWYLSTSAGPQVVTITGGNAANRLRTVLNVTNMPTSDPGVAGQLWSDSGVLNISSG